MATRKAPVFAIDNFDDRPGFSNYGPGTVHIAAPGVGILSTQRAARRPGRFSRPY